MDPQRSGARESDDKLEQVLVFLRARGDWISSQITATGDADEIEVRQVQEIIDRINKVLPGLEHKNRSLAKSLTELRDMCFSAKLARREGKYPQYFQYLRVITQQLTSL